MGQNCTIIAIAGGSGSGKSVLAEKISELLESEHCNIISQDSYYYDHSENFDEDGGAINFDHPSSIEFSLLAEHLTKLQNGQPVEIPNYDFVTHGRMQKGHTITPSPVILLDGTLLLSQDEILAHVDASIFVDVSQEIRLERRIARDVEYRGRKKEGILKQWNNQVQPMHEEFVDSFTHRADLCLDGTRKIENNARLVIQEFNLFG